MTLRPGPHGPLDELRSPAFIERFCRVPAPGGKLVPMVLYPAQRQFLDAWDAVDVDGLPVYRTGALYWIKKAGKSSLAAAIGVKELVNGRGHDREIIVVSSTFEQSKDRVFSAARRFCGRHPWLSKAVRQLADTLVFKETIVNPATGGTYTEEHVLKAVPSNAEGLHGAEPSLVIFDEAHTLADYSLLEALAPAPTRLVSRRLFASYSGLRHQQKRSIFPWWDMHCQWRDGTLPADTFVSFIGGPDGWRQVPWISEKFLESQRRAFEAAPSRFARLYLNEWADDESSLITRAELDAAISDYAEPVRLDGCWASLDLGVKHDSTVLHIGHVNERAQLVLDVWREWRPTRGKSVSLMEVADEIARLYLRFKWRDLWVDSHQARLLVEQLQQTGVPASLIEVTASVQNQVTTSLKGAFAQRWIRIPASALPVIEQLESVRAIESRRGLLKLTEGKGTEGRAHDDHAFALGLLVLMAADAIGRCGLPEQSYCYRAESINVHVPCYLWGGPYVPSGCPACRNCESHRAVMAGWKEHGRGLDLRTYRQLHAGDNTLTLRQKELKSRQRAQAWADGMCI